jgi:hypothetical protein
MRNRMRKVLAFLGLALRSDLELARYREQYWCSAWDRVNSENTLNYEYIRAKGLVWQVCHCNKCEGTRLEYK